MKKIYFILVMLIVVSSACTDQFADYNTDKKHPLDVPGESLFTNAQKETSDFVNNTNVNINIFKLMSQYWTETTYTDEANYDLITRNIPANIYLRLYMRVLTDLKQSAKLIGDKPTVFDSEKPVKQNKLQIIEMMNVYVYSQLVDIFGMVPYSQALDINNVYPKYDDGYTIYKDLFKRLDAALSKLDEGSESFGSTDIYYKGDVAAWVKFGNSLKIRMAITIADADNVLAKSAIESAADKCFQSNDDDCLLLYVTSAPNYNQLYADLVATGRHDFVAANTMIDIMNSLNDPRLASYFTKTDTSTVAGVAKLAYVGGQFGFSSPYSQCSHVAAVIQKPDFPGIMLTYSEIQFYLAEASARNYSLPKTAAEYYNEGIRSSFKFWGTQGVETYLSKPEVAYSTASSDWKHTIGLQSWLANYTRGLEGYNTWRRLDYPIFNIPEFSTKYADIPVRFTFPVNEQTLNADNYNAASKAIGGDLISTKIFWDKY